MILLLVFVLLLGAFFLTDAFLELLAGSALIVLPISLVQGAWSVSLTCVLLLAACVGLMIVRDG